MKTFLFLFFLSSSVFGANLKTLTKNYSEWIGINQNTLFCQCRQIEGMSLQSTCGAPLSAPAERLTPHYIVPLKFLASNYPEYTKGHRKCHRGGKNFQGIECVEIVHPKFKEIMEDRHNLTLIEPSVAKVLEGKILGSLTTGRKLGACPLVYDDNYFASTALAQGWIARVYLHMYKSYGDLNFDANLISLAERTSRAYPPSVQECRVTKKINEIQESKNKISTELCEKNERKKI